MLATALFTLLFLALHFWWLRRQPPLAFSPALRISRGLGALLLTIAGLICMLANLDLWPRAFVAPVTKGDPSYLPTYLALGHFLADFLWLAYGKLARGEKPRMDLIIHHGAGLVACGLVLSLEMATVLLAVALTAEVMPITSGILGWAGATGNSRLAKIAVRLRLASLLCWRLPLWIFLTVVTVGIVSHASAPENMLFLYRLILVFLAFIILLDLYWSRLCWRNLRRRSEP